MHRMYSVSYASSYARDVKQPRRLRYWRRSDADQGFGTATPFDLDGHCSAADFRYQDWESCSIFNSAFSGGVATISQDSAQNSRPRQQIKPRAC